MRTSLWARNVYKDMLLTNGSIMQLPDTNESVRKAKTEMQEFTDEIVSIVANRRVHHDAA